METTEDKWVSIEFQVKKIPADMVGAQDQYFG